MPRHIERFTFTFSSKPSRAYQTVTAEMSVEVAMGEGDSFADVVQDVIPMVVQRVVDTVETELQELVRLKQELDGYTPERERGGHRGN